MPAKLAKVKNQKTLQKAEKAKPAPSSGMAYYQIRATVPRLIIQVLESKLRMS